MVQLNVFARFCNVYFLHRVDKHIQNKEFSKINREAWLSLLPIGLSRALASWHLIDLWKQCC